MVDAHRPGAFAHRLAERHVEVAEDAGRDGSLGRRHLALREIDTFFGVKSAHQAPVPAHLDHAPHRPVVRPGSLAHARESERVAADRHRIAGRHAHVALDLVTLHHRHAGDEHGDAKVGERHPPPGARLLTEAGKPTALRVPDPLPHAGNRRGRDPGRKPETEARER